MSRPKMCSTTRATPWDRSPHSTQALIERHSIIPPFQGLTRQGVSCSQRVALGWSMTPLWGCSMMLLIIPTKDHAGPQILSHTHPLNPLPSRLTGHLHRQYFRSGLALRMN